LVAPAIDDHALVHEASILGDELDGLRTQNLKIIGDPHQHLEIGKVAVAVGDESVERLRELKGLDEDAPPHSPETTDISSGSCPHIASIPPPNFLRGCPVVEGRVHADLSEGVANGADVPMDERLLGQSWLATEDGVQSDEGVVDLLGDFFQYPESERLNRALVR
jgi:hypothetical protein